MTITHPMDRVEPSTQLQKSPLWDGSSEKLLADLKMLKIQDLQSKYESLLTCDDRTSGENQLMADLKHDIDAYEKSWDFNFDD